MFPSLVFACTCALAVTAASAAQQHVFEVENQDVGMPRDPTGMQGFRYDLSTAPQIAVSESRVVVAGSHALILFDKADPATELEAVTYGHVLTETNYPFVPVTPSTTDFDPSLVFPRAEYDPYTGRLWIAYLEQSGVFSDVGSPERSVNCSPTLHLAVQKDLATNPQTDFSTNQWWFYTGTTATAPQGMSRTAFNLANDHPVTGLQPFRPDGLDPALNHNAPISVRMPSLAFDEHVIVVAVTEPDSCATSASEDTLVGGRQKLIIIPRNHAGGSTADGDRPLESDIIVADLQTPPIYFDESFHNTAVQEPFDRQKPVPEFENLILFISTEGASRTDDLMQDIRLKALFLDDQGTPGDPSDDEWELRQQLDGNDPASYFLEGVDVHSVMGEYRIDSTALDTDNAATPNFEPTVEGDFITSAVLADDLNGDPRVFAVHAVKSTSGMGPSDFWQIQWYVFDPKLTDIIDSDVQDKSWQPTLEGWGEIQTLGDGNEVYGHCYHPVLAVTPQGKAFIEYTFSSPTAEHRIVRAELSSDYKGVVNSTTLKMGPSLEYSSPNDFDRWALYADMQADPTTTPGVCKWLWSTHTLADEVPNPGSPATVTSRRDIWMFRNKFANCFGTDLNQSGFTDGADMMLYTDWYTTADPKADLNEDGAVDIIDMADYIDAYTAATGP